MLGLDKVFWFSFSENSVAIALPLQSTPRNLRKRKQRVEDDIRPPSKRFCGVVARMENRVPKLLPAPKSSLAEGLVVIAKMRSYAAWPAKIKSFRKTCVDVHFFGDDSTGTVSYVNIGFFGDNEELIRQNLKKNITGYLKAVRCAEIFMNVPSNISILNTV